MIISDARCYVHNKDWIYGATVFPSGGNAHYYVVLWNIENNSSDSVGVIRTSDRKIAEGHANAWTATRTGWNEGPQGFLRAVSQTAAEALQAEQMGGNNIVHGAIDPWKILADNEGNPTQTVDPVALDGTFVPYAINPFQARMLNKECICEHHLNAHGPIELGGGWRCLVAVCTCPGYRHKCPECGLFSMRSPTHKQDCRTGIVEATMIDPTDKKREAVRLATELWNTDELEEEV